MNKKVIPWGYYCYNKKGDCPHWRRLWSYNINEDGYCEYLGKTDWDINEERGRVILYDKDDNSSGLESAHSLHYSMLYDKLKACDVRVKDNLWERIKDWINGYK